MPGAIVDVSPRVIGPVRPMPPSVPPARLMAVFGSEPLTKIWPIACRMVPAKSPEPSMRIDARQDVPDLDTAAAGDRARHHQIDRLRSVRHFEDGHRRSQRQRAVAHDGGDARRVDTAPSVKRRCRTLGGRIADPAADQVHAPHRELLRPLRGRSGRLLPASTCRIWIVSIASTLSSAPLRMRTLAVSLMFSFARTATAVCTPL